MFTKIKEHTNIRKVILFMCLMPVLMAAMGLYYMWRLEAVLYDTVQKSMHEVGAHASSVVEECLGQTIEDLIHAAHNPLLADVQNNRQEAFHYLREVLKKNNWYDILIANMQGEAISINGLRMHIGERDYFQKALQGIPCSSPRIEKVDYAAPVLAHGAPIFDEKGDVAGVLVVLEDVNRPHFLHGITYESTNDAELVFVDAHGSWIHRSKVNTDSFWKKILTENNLPITEESYALIEKYEKEATPLLFEGQESLITLDPIGNTGWKVVSISPRKNVADNVDDIIEMSMFFVVCLFVALFFCMLYLLQVSNAYRRYKNFALAVSNTNGIFYFYVDDQGFVHSANDYFYKQLGWKNPEQSMQLFDYVEGLSMEQLHDFLQERVPFVLTMVPPEGQPFHMQCTTMPHVREGKMHLLLGTDISVYKANREVEIIKTQHDELQQIINALPNTLMVHSAEGVRLANKAALDVLGVNSLKELRAGILYGMDSKTFEKQVQMVAGVLKDGMPRNSTFDFVDPNGKEFVFQNMQSPVYDDDGKVKYAVNLCVDITDTLRLQKQLEGELQRLHEILDSSPSGFFYTQAQNVEYCNPAIQDMMGIEVGKPFPMEELNLCQEVTAVRAQLENGINVYDLPISVVDPHNHERHLSVTVLGTTWYGKWHHMVWAHDVTTIHQVQKELIGAKDAAEAAARAKSDFLATMSHEIRTPMNAVLGFLQVFDKSNLHQTQLDYIEKITISAKGLLRIINDILDFSKIEANKMDLEYVPFNLVANMDAVYSIMHFTASDKGLAFTRSMDERVPAFVMGDGERLNQVLLNLLSNAIKFTEKGSVTLHIGLHEQIDEEHFVLECSVSDTGIGLSEEQAYNLFKPFTQADTSTSRRFGGTGLGLVISQRIIQLMGGNIELRSELGKGSTFTCIVPVRKANDEDLKTLQVAQKSLEEQNAAQDEAKKVASLKGKSVLVAEDNFINQEIAAAMLEEYELDLDFANNGEEAVAAVQKKKYDLIFMDLQMPIMNGLDATKNIRALGETDPYFKEMPIIAMTANVMHEDRRSCEDAGMNDHVGKPISAQMLHRALLTWLAR